MQRNVILQSGRQSPANARLELASLGISGVGDPSVGTPIAAWGSVIDLSAIVFDKLSGLAQACGG